MSELEHLFIGLSLSFASILIGFLVLRISKTRCNHSYRKYGTKNTVTIDYDAPKLDAPICYKCGHKKGDDDA